MYKRLFKDVKAKQGWRRSSFFKCSHKLWILEGGGGMGVKTIEPREVELSCMIFDCNV